MPSFSASKRTKVLHRAKVVNAMLDIVSEAESTVDVCGNSNFLEAIVSYESLKKVILTQAMNSKSRHRYIFEITMKNIPYYNQLAKIAAGGEVRHSDEIDANFIVSEKEYLGSITPQC